MTFRKSFGKNDFESDVLKDQEPGTSKCHFPTLPDLRGKQAMTSDRDLPDP